MNEQKEIIVYGAREHNLKNINIRIPRNQFIVITGVSGSGKSSLAFDTIYAEGQRRYLESLSSYARQFLDRVQKPNVEHIEGLSPAISIEQKTTNYNPRSTVGTVTEIYDYLRLLFARIGIPYSPTTGLPIQSQTISEMIDTILSLEQGTCLFLLAPIIQGRKGEHKKEIIELQKKGFQRLKIDNIFYLIEDVPDLEKNKTHTIDVVVDRIVVNQDIRVRLSDSLETALKLSNGLVVLEFADDLKSEKKLSKQKSKKLKQIVLSEKFACPVSGFTITELEPRFFSFNSPFGACPKCNGLGIEQKPDISLMIPNPSLSINHDAIVPWSSNFSSFHKSFLNALSKYYSFDLDTPWEQLSPEIKKLILYGDSQQKFTFEFIVKNKQYQTTRIFEGLVDHLNRRWVDAESSSQRDSIERYMISSPCTVCKGYRLKPEALSIKIQNLHIGQISDFSIVDARDWIHSLPTKLSKQQHQIAETILKEISDRLNFLLTVGLDYLSLSRTSSTLSGGESQRIRLASQIGSGLTGVLYVLDEPSIGLHQKDNERLLNTLRRLVMLGNTVLVVEHDEDAILAADHIIDIGPGAGNLGGEIIAQGKIDDILKNPNSLTGQYLRGDLTIERTPKKITLNTTNTLIVHNADKHNLKNITVKIPIGALTCITGVSGSGKSTFLLDILLKSAQLYLQKLDQPHSQKWTLEGFNQIDKVIHIDQSPIGRTPRSNPATYTGVFTYIREWYANLPNSKARGYSPGRFSFNVKGGRCEACQGDGVVKVEMHFLPNVYVNCDVCKGKRYNPETLEIKYKNKSISDVLEMTVREGLIFFSAIPNIKKELTTLVRVGLDYIKIGQPATTLSGGEAQRIKFSRELSKRSTGRTLYILDEPTTGLHFHDISKLLDLLDEFVKNGNTVIVIEHNLDIIKNADWIIDFGPDGGDRGGTIIAEGSPEKIIKSSTSYTGKFLKRFQCKNKKL